MKVSFNSRLEAIDWIAQNTSDEKTFETLREQLNYNFIYENIYYLEVDEQSPGITLEDDFLEN